MKTLQTIYNKLNSVEKTELETHKVEFALVDDLSKQVSNASALVNKIDASLKNNEKMWDEVMKLEKQLDASEEKAKKEFAKIEASAKSGDKLIASMDKLYDKLQKTAKDLGVSPKDIKGFAQWEDAYDDLSGLERKVRELVN